MIKGVSKQIIEIKCTDNEYFEKALLFVNSSCSAFPEYVLTERAKELAAGLSEEETQAFGEVGKNKNDVMKRVMSAVGIAAVAASVVGFLFWVW